MIESLKEQYKKKRKKSYITGIAPRIKQIIK
jgi:hypothetical protein